LAKDTVKHLYVSARTGELIFDELYLLKAKALKVVNALKLAKVLCPATFYFVLN